MKTQTSNIEYKHYPFTKLNKYYKVKYVKKEHKDTYKMLWGINAMRTNIGFRHMSESEVIHQYDVQYTHINQLNLSFVKQPKDIKTFCTI